METGIGATLREAREAQSRSIDDVAGSLRARVTQLRDLEDERFDAFGGDVYAKGFLKSYAAELGLDPAPLLDIYRREVSSDDTDPGALVTPMARPKRQRSASPPAWIAWVLVAVIAVAGITAIGMLGPGTAPETASPEGDEVDTAPPAPVGDEDDGDEDGAATDDGATDGDATDDDDDGAGDADDAGDDVESDAESEADADDEADEEAEPDGVELLLEFEDRSWMRVEVDGSLVQEGIIEAGEILPFDADEEILVRLGNAGGVRAQLNGEDLGAQGGRGDVVSVVFTPEGAEIA